MTWLCAVLAADSDDLELNASAYLSLLEEILGRARIYLDGELREHL